MSQIVEYSVTESALSELASRFKGVQFDVTNKDGMKAAKEGRAELRTLRVDLEKKRKEIKEPALERCREIDSEAKRITSAIELLENPIDAQIKDYEARLEEIKNAAERAAFDLLQKEERERREAEERKVAEERALFEKQKAELAEQQRAFQEKMESEQRASRLAIEEAERVARAKMEEEARAARAMQEAIEAGLKAERDRVEALRREEEENQRKAAEKLRQEQLEREAVQREAQRKEEKRLQQIADAKTLLQMFVERYSTVPDFVHISQAINKFLGDYK